MKALTEQERHNMAMNIVRKQLEADGFEFKGVNNTLKKNPQFVCLKEEQLYFIVVRNVVHPENPRKFDKTLMKKMKEHANQHKGRACYAGVGLSNADDQTLPVYLNESCKVSYDGLIEMKDD